ncbi:molybdate transport system ATP-binding protein [Octadecabacter temperatus]|uniref:Sulfate/thiosulfate import ATP-binding protein CysA n=1 Tax=Octadecabacter temperatus TaxID=1458307 RepID=A0A0K0Y305_9RHOB|nr:molybdenum ABC transporter ATP-binding protein [Octadecabacter temperatus]AKS45335.1 Sulfate/thiosulfate import ATP-binding protein CysA [Octadecabacter temperatus]SIN90755.1 molybdate transport system ATP-binding protein [Octadecabacter temperatus]
MLKVSVAKSFEGFSLDVAFEAPAGVTAIFGPSGSGKTSIIRAVAGVLDCDRADISLDGEVLSDLPPHKRKVGYVFQDARLFPHMTVLKNLRYGGTHDEEAVIAVLGLGALLERYPASLSGGEKQRVALGRALMSAPKVLLLDEPLSALDGPRKAEVLPYLEALRDQTSIPILYVSHDMGEVARMASRIVVIDQGKVALSGEVQDVLADPAAVPFVGLGAAGAVLTGRVVGLADDGLTKIETGAGALWVPGAVGRTGSHARVRIPAQDVILSRSAPKDMSALNVLSATITALEHGKGPGVAVALQAGDARLLARITKRSCQAMKLKDGDQVFAILKATAIAPSDVS